MGMDLAGLAALATMSEMTVPRRYGESEAVRASYDRAGYKVPNAYYGRWVARKDKQHRLKGLRP